MANLLSVDAFIGDRDFLVGDELEEYMDAFLEDDDEINEDFSEEDDEESTEAISCSCGKPAIQRTAKCSMVHYTCGTDGENRAIDAVIDLCDCCKFMALVLDTDEVVPNEPAVAAVSEVSSSQPLAQPKSSKKKANTRKRKGPATRPLVYTEEHAKRDVPKFLLDALQNIKTHPIYGRAVFKSSQVIIVIAAEVVEKEGSEEFIKFQDQFTSSLWKIVSSTGNKVGGAADDTLCKGLVQLRKDETLHDLWNSVSGSDAEESIHLLLHVIRQTIAGLVKARNKMDFPPQMLQSEIDLGEHDEQVLRYASGYIPFSLVKQYMRQNNNRAKAMRAFLQTWKVPADQDTEETGTFLQYTRKWIEKVNRGKLFTFNDTVYKFFRAMEIESRKTLTKEAMMCPDLYEQLLGKLDQNIYIPRLWDSLVKDQLPRSYSDHLLHVMKLKFAKMRVTAYVTVYFMFRQLQDKNVSRRGERALRKELAQ